MLNPGDIVYGFAKNLHRPKNKYAICIFRDDNVEILMHFTTSQARSGVPLEQVHHGAIYKDGDCLSYVFEPDHEIGTNKTTGDRFHFPIRTVMVFDYGYLKGDEQYLLSQFDNLQVKCTLDEKEYIDLVYAMYSSKSTPDSYKPYLDKILTDYFSDK